MDETKERQLELLRFLIEKCRARKEIEFKAEAHLLRLYVEARDFGKPVDMYGVKKVLREAQDAVASLPSRLLPQTH